MSLEKVLHKIVQRLPIHPDEKDALEAEVTMEFAGEDEDAAE